MRLPPAQGAEIIAVACHLKSKLLSFPVPGGRSSFTPRDEGQRARFAAYALNRRAAEAVTVLALADQLLHDQRLSGSVLVLGDLNDEPQAATTQILLGPPGSEIGTPGAGRPDKSDGSRLGNLAPLIPDEQRFSRIYQGRRELIDHILASHAAVNRIQSVHTTSARPLPSISDDAPTRRNATASDHALVFTDLT